MKWLMLPLLFSFAVSGCQKSLPETEVSGEAQGTTYHIKLVLDENSTVLVEARKQITVVLADIDAKMSNYREDSEISLLNKQENSDWLPVSREIMDLLVIAKTVYDKTDGCYDLTVKPLFDLWGFSKHENRIPTDLEIANLLPHIGMSLLDIDSVNLRIRKKDPKLKIDLASIAQGYSVGAVAHGLETLGINNYLVEIGGEMMVKGHKANGDNWRVGLETPRAGTRDLQRVLVIKETKGEAVMTAGTYRNYFEENGQSYSHILNPKLGRPVNHNLRSVTILHDDPSWADAWDTALLCVGDNAMQIAESENLKVLLIYEKDKQFQENMSKAFAAAM